MLIFQAIYDSNYWIFTDEYFGMVSDENLRLWLDENISKLLNYNNNPDIWIEFFTVFLSDRNLNFREENESFIYDNIIKYNQVPNDDNDEQKIYTIDDLLDIY
jgi:hypothetical protein